MKSGRDIHLPDLAAHIAQVHVRRPLPEIITAILKTGISPSNIFRALMKCQLLILEYKLPEFLGLPPDEHIKGLMQTIEHFNYIEASIVELGEKVWLAEIQETKKELKVERQARILAASLQQWQKDEKVKLLNYYKGLPVQAIGKVMDIVGGMKAVVSVRASSELGRVLAISDQQQVLAPDSEDAVYINMEALHVTGESITFYVKGISPMERRNNLRLEPLSPTSINLYRNKESVGCGKILDLSLSHIALSISDSDTYPFKQNEIIDFQFQLDQNSLQGAAWVRLVRKDSDRLIICIEIMPDAALQRQLQQETAIIQRKIIQEIRRKFTAVS